MQINNQKNVLIYYITVCIVVFYTVLVLFAAINWAFFLLLPSAVLSVTAFVLFVKKNKKLFAKLQFIAAVAALAMLDSHINYNTGFVLLYIPLLMVAIFGNNIKNSIISTAALLAIFILVNQTAFLPQIGSAINKVYGVNFTFYFNLTASLVSIYVLLLEPNKKELPDEEKIITTNDDYLKTIADCSANPIWVIDKNYTLIYCNNKYKEKGYLLTVKQINPSDNVLSGYADITMANSWKAYYDKALSGINCTALKEVSVNGVKQNYIVYFNTVLNHLDAVTACAVTAVLQKTTDEIKTYKPQTDNDSIKLVLEYYEDVMLLFCKEAKCTRVLYTDATKLFYPENYYNGKNVTQLFDEPFKINISKITDNVNNLQQPKEVEFSFKINGLFKHFKAIIKPLKNNTENSFAIILKDITAIKQLLNVQIKQEQFLTKLMDNLPVGIFTKDVKQGLVYTSWNKELTSLFGITEDKVLGKTDFDIFSNLNKEQIEAYAQTDAMVLDTKEPLLINQLNLQFDSETLTIKIIKLPITDKNGNVELIIGIVQNISEFNSLQEVLKQTENRWNAALESSQTPFWDINLNKGEVYFSSIFKDMLGYDENENPNLVLEELIHPADVDEVNKKLLAHINGKTKYYRAAYKIKKKDGSFLWVLDRGKAYAFDDEGNAVRIAGTFSDITQSKQLDDRLIAAKNAETEAAQAKVMFVGNLCKQIRKPINSVTQIIKQLNESSDTNVLELAKTLQINAHRLTQLLNNMLYFKTLDAGELDLEKVEFNMHLLVHNIVSEFYTNTAEKQIQLNINTDNQLPHVLIGDPARITQVITNLLSNAVNFTSEGNITVDVLLRNKTENHASIEISVSDTGAGINEEKLSGIFDAFNLTKTDYETNNSGIGLGLAICKKLTDLFGSKLYVSSKPGLGSKFWFTVKLPYLNKLVVETNETDLNPPLISLNNMHVLVAESNKLNLYVMSKMLNQWGVNYHVAENGKAAVDMFKKNNYDLILMDLHLAEMDGFEVVEIIRSKNNAIPVFAIVAELSSDIKNRLTTIGINGYITKPFKPNELLNMLVNIYQQQKKLSVNLRLFN